ncbi:tail fiber assembly protein [Escherichia coli]|nr:tail fiber assembly protein [Escherichia coli]EIG1356021.1 tail fiber assembly protein [Escherichia coli]EIG1359140.1 tail fiber assembly protein [Escherichia coli]EIG1366045.1 tail fiber assembly protein [Escherichia coli]EIG2045407.1 tail fiber assembly protein [Escherichia coli]EJK2760145.1 tail fiber assembly protein [Escherichia coli]
MFENATIDNPRTTNINIYIDVDIHLNDQSITFTSMPDDSEIYSVEIYKRALNGEFGKIITIENDVFSANKLQKDMLQSRAAESITVLEYAVELKMATEKEMQLLNEWKKYVVLLSRVNLTNPKWPEVPGDVA